VLVEAAEVVVVVEAAEVVVLEGVTHLPFSAVPKPQ